MVLKELILTVSTLGGCGVLNDTWTYINEYHNTGYGGLERKDY